jgi:small-conductance mechanosensitive channel
VKFQMQNAAHFPAIPYSFADDKRDAYHAGARPSVIDAEMRRIDTDEVLFTTRKKPSQLTNSEMEEEIEQTQFLRAQAQGAAVKDILAVHAQKYTDAPPVDRLSSVLTSDKRLDQHLENIHRTRFLQEMKKVAKNPPAATKPASGGGSEGGGRPGGTGGLPATPSSPRPTTEPGSQATTTETTINARRERLNGARQAVQTLKKQEQTAESEAARNKIMRDRRAIASFGTYLQNHPDLTDPQAIDREMDKVLDDNQKQYIAGLF